MESAEFVRRGVVGILLGALVACGGGGGAAPAGGGALPPDPSPPAPPIAGTLPDLGPNADLRGTRPFASTDPWNTVVDAAPVDPNSDILIASIGVAKGVHPDFGANWNGGPFGIPYVVVPGSQARVPMSFQYADESDAGPYPVPPDAPIEGGPTSSGDRHILVIDRDAWKLYETWSTYPATTGLGFDAGSGAVFDLATNTHRPAGFTSADAAGLPIFPGLVRYDEVVLRGTIPHALRFTVQRSRRGYVAPATHFASAYTGADRPPMGMRVRLKGAYDLSTFPASARVVLQALKTYGMFVADNGGDWFLSGAPDARWNDDELNALKSVPGSAFEVLRMGPVTTN